MPVILRVMILSKMAFYFLWIESLFIYFFCIKIVQVVAGELELKEYNLNWAPEDFESKLQARNNFSLYFFSL